VAVECGLLEVASIGLSLHFTFDLWIVSELEELDRIYIYVYK
jgi:hypothetical protein